MKRDLYLIRSILQKIESWDEPQHLEDLFPIDGYGENQIAYHVKILFNDNAITAEPFDEFGVPYRRFFNIELTNHGHDALAALKDDTKIKKFLAFCVKTGTAITIDLFLSWSKKMIS